jgi:hypothetical protein
MAWVSPQPLLVLRRNERLHRNNTRLHPNPFPPAWQVKSLDYGNPHAYVAFLTHRRQLYRRRSMLLGALRKTLSARLIGVFEAAQEGARGL